MYQRRLGKKQAHQKFKGHPEDKKKKPMKVKRKDKLELGITKRLQKQRHKFKKKKIAPKMIAGEQPIPTPIPIPVQKILGVTKM